MSEPVKITSPRLEKKVDSTPNANGAIGWDDTISQEEREYVLLPEEQYVREHLEGYRRRVLLLAALERDLSKIGGTGSPGGIHAQRYTDAPRGTNNMAAASLQAWDGLLKRRDDLAESLSGEGRQEALRIINAEEDPRTVMILTLYYLHGLTDQQIADQLFISRRQANLRRNNFIHRCLSLP